MPLRITARIYIPRPTRSTTARAWMGHLRSFHADGAHARSRCRGRCIARRPTRAPATVRA
ncbi:MAG: hypothetical protein MZV64_59210 [Ignavibacteriales bacterium]|nr:hypothetical protein [Ignavibacteriales bacterium]